MNNLKELRKQAGLTLQEVADKACTSKSHIFGIENNGSEPSVYLAYRIAKAVKKPVIKVFPEDTGDRK